MHLVKTEVGQKVFKDRSIPLSPRQRSAFIIFDGKRTLDEVLAATAGLGLTQDDVNHMIELGLLAPLSLPMAATATEAQHAVPMISGEAIQPPARQMVEITAAVVSLAEAQARYTLAYPMATQLTANLGLRGFRLNLAVEAAGSYSQMLELFPKIRDAVGVEKSMALERALRGG